MSRKGYAWVMTGPQKKSLTDVQKRLIGYKCEEAIAFLKKKHVAEPNPDFGYTINIFGKWFRSYYYFIQTMRYDNPSFLQKEQDFKFARLEFFSPTAFGLSYMRLNDEWFMLYNNISLDEALEAVKEDPLFLAK
jgi:hypothetical protein